MAPHGPDAGLRGPWRRFAIGCSLYVVLDLGCGKGEYTVACAKMRPDVLFVGLTWMRYDAPRCRGGRCGRRGQRGVLMDGVPSFDDEVEAGIAGGALFPAAIPAILPKARRSSLLIVHAAPQPVRAVIAGRFVDARQMS